MKRNLYAANSVLLVNTALTTPFGLPALIYVIALLLIRQKWPQKFQKLHAISFIAWGIIDFLIAITIIGFSYFQRSRVISHIHNNHGAGKGIFVIICILLILAGIYLIVSGVRFYKTIGSQESRMHRV